MSCPQMPQASTRNKSSSSSGVGTSRWPILRLPGLTNSTTCISAASSANQQPVFATDDEIASLVKQEALFDDHAQTWTALTYARALNGELTMHDIARQDGYGEADSVPTQCRLAR